MTDRIFFRRDLFARGAGLLALCGLLPFAGKAQAKEKACFDPKIGDRTLAKSLHYTEEAKDPRKICDVCKNFTEQSAPCGPCTLLRGPVNPGGYCDAWV